MSTVNVVRQINELCRIAEIVTDESTIRCFQSRAGASPHQKYLTTGSRIVKHGDRWVYVTSKSACGFRDWDLVEQASPASPEQLAEFGL